jgi:branched-chain amino acid transport system ATP-binding protein
LIQRQVEALDGGAGPEEAGPTLRARDITVRFGGVIALSEVSIEVKPHGIHALIGPNGAGKSTLVNVVAGFREPDAGTVELFGHPAGRMSAIRRARNGLGRTFQHPALFGTLTIRENLALAQRSRGSGKVDWLDGVLRDLDLWHWQDVVVDAAPYPVRKLTDMVRALAASPSLLLVDEPAAGLASSERESLADLLEWANTTLGCSLLLIEHDMPLVFRLADYVTVLSNGRRIAGGTAEEIRAHPDVIEAYLGTKV